MTRTTTNLTTNERLLAEEREAVEAIRERRVEQRPEPHARMVAIVEQSDRAMQALGLHGFISAGSYVGANREGGYRR